MKNISLSSFFSKFPDIDLGDIKLRDLSLRDTENYYKLFADPKVSQYLSDEDIPNSLEAALTDVKFWGSLFYRKQGVFWAITTNKNDQLIGTIGFNSWNFHNKRGEISYDLMSEYWGQGIMTRVITNIMVFAFSKMGIYRVEARTMKENERSQKLLYKIGFKQEGILRGYRIIRDEPQDIALFSLISPDFSGNLITA